MAFSISMLMEGIHQYADWGLLGHSRHRMVLRRSHLHHVTSF